MVANWVMAVGRCNKIAGYQYGSLVDQLIKGMLAIGAWFAPDNRTGIVANGLYLLRSTLLPLLSMLPC